MDKQFTLSPRFKILTAVLIFIGIVALVTGAFTDSSRMWANLLLKDESWAPWVDTLDPQQPPLSTLQGPALFIVHARDPQGLAALRAFFPHGVAILHTYPDGEPSFYSFYAER